MTVIGNFLLIFYFFKKLFFKFLCTSLNFNTLGKVNFKKFLNTGQGDGQRGGAIRYNHIYLKNPAVKLNFPYTCARS